MNMLLAGTRPQANELFHGRLAMLGFAAALINQMRMGGLAGPGPLAQVHVCHVTCASRVWQGEHRSPSR